MGFCKRCRQRWFASLFPWISPPHEKAVRERRTALLAQATSPVLEIGPGTGTNLDYLPPDVSWQGVEPNPYFHEVLRKKLAEQNRPGNLLGGTAEALPVADNSVNTVVATLVFCSVTDLGTSLKEIRRVLLPGGQLLFLEHVAAPRGTWLRRWQRFWSPLWRQVGDGCHLARDTAEAISQAGFSDVQCDRFWLPRSVAPAIVSPHICGVARK